MRSSKRRPRQYQRKEPARAETPTGPQTLLTAPHLNLTMATAHAQGKVDFWSRPDLSLTAKSLAEVLEQRTAKRYSESLLSSKKLAELLGRSVRTVQYALAELRRAGLVAVRTVRSLAVRSGHIITLLWRGERPLFRAELDATECGSSTRLFALNSDLPPDPPIEEPEGTLERDNDGSPPCSDLSTTSDKTPSAEASPEIVAEVVKRAEAIVGNSPTVRARLGELSGHFRHGWATLHAALDAAHKKHAYEPVRNLYGFLWRVGERIETTGGPPPVQTESERRAAEEERMKAAMARIFELAGITPQEQCEP